MVWIFLKRKFMVLGPVLAYFSYTNEGQARLAIQKSTQDGHGISAGSPKMPKNAQKRSKRPKKHDFFIKNGNHPVYMRALEEK